MENTSSIIIIICRAAALEAALVQAASSESDQVLRNALVRLYATVLGYLADARAYFLQSTSSIYYETKIPIHGTILILHRAYFQERVFHVGS